MMGSCTEGHSDVCTVSLMDASYSVEDSSACPGLSPPGEKNTKKQREYTTPTSLSICSVSIAKKNKGTNKQLSF